MGEMTINTEIEFENRYLKSHEPSETHLYHM